MVGLFETPEPAAKGKALGGTDTKRVSCPVSRVLSDFALGKSIVYEEVLKRRSQTLGGTGSDRSCRASQGVRSGL